MLDCRMPGVFKRYQDDWDKKSMVLKAKFVVEKIEMQLTGQFLCSPDAFLFDKDPPSSVLKVLVCVYVR